MATLPLSERLRPVRLDEVVGNPRAKTDLRAWAAQWQGSKRPARRRAAVLSGPAGVGKTSAALALAHDMGWTVVEMNASDARNESAINQVAGRASLAQSLGDGRGPHGTARALILLDEADCLTGRLTETARPRAEPPPLREFLRARYGSVDSLNAAWGLAAGGRPAPFGDWEDLPKAAGTAAWTRLPSARRDLDDWRSTQRATDLSDRGGLGAIARLVRQTRQPLVLTVNDEQPLTRYSPTFRNEVLRIHFLPIREHDLRARLEAAVRSEALRLVPGALDAIVHRAHGDLRAALNDLDSISALEPGPGQLAVLGVRDRAADLAALVEESLSSPRFFRSTEVQDRLDAPPDDLLPWIEENLPRFAPDASRTKAGFDVLSIAERFLARARRWRVWSQWSYASELMTGGVGLALRERPVGPGGAVAFPQFLSEMGRSRGARAVREALVAKAGARFHLSHEKTREVVLPFLEGLYRAPAGRRGGRTLLRVLRGIGAELELTPEEVGLLTGDAPDSPRVRELMALSEQIPEETSPEPGAMGAPAPSRDRAGGQRHLSDFAG